MWSSCTVPVIRKELYLKPRLLSVVIVSWNAHQLWGTSSSTRWVPGDGCSEKIPAGGCRVWGIQANYCVLFLKLFIFFRMSCFFLSLCDLIMLPNMVFGIPSRGRILNSGQLKCHFGMRRLKNICPAFRPFLILCLVLHHWTFLWGAQARICLPLLRRRADGFSEASSEPRPMGSCCCFGLPLTVQSPPSPLLIQQSPGQ